MTVLPATSAFTSQFATLTAGIVTLSDYLLAAMTVAAMPLMVIVLLAAMGEKLLPLMTSVSP